MTLIARGLVNLRCGLVHVDWPPLDYESEVISKMSGRNQ